MIDVQLANQTDFDDPALYRICVRGRLEPGWAERMGMTASWLTQENGPTLTVLQGELRDQAALAGILTTLYDLHLSLLSLECLSGPEATQAHDIHRRRQYP